MEYLPIYCTTSHHHALEPPNMSAWAFNLRSHQHVSDSSDDDETPNSNLLSDDAQLVRDLDLSSRPEQAIFKPNPWNIAKINAASRSRVPSTELPQNDFSTRKYGPENAHHTGPLVDAFKKQIQTRPANVPKPGGLMSQPRHTPGAVSAGDSPSQATSPTGVLSSMAATPTQFSSSAQRSSSQAKPSSRTSPTHIPTGSTTAAACSKTTHVATNSDIQHGFRSPSSQTYLSFGGGHKTPTLNSSTLGCGPSASDRKSGLMNISLDAPLSGFSTNITVSSSECLPEMFPLPHGIQLGLSGPFPC